MALSFSLDSMATFSFEQNLVNVSSTGRWRKAFIPILHLSLLVLHVEATLWKGTTMCTSSSIFNEAGD